MTIGIPGWLVGPNSYGVTISYLDFIKEYMGTDILILLPESPVMPLDLLLLPGGADINPSRYGEAPSFYTDKPDIFKEYFDTHILPRYIEQGTPIFGICRGMQSLSIHFGARLIQNMWHETNKPEDPYEAVHYVTISNDEKRKVKVNSRHHQCISGEREYTSDSLLVLARNTKYNHIEAIRIIDKPICGVQWHPEDLNDVSGIEYTLELITSILK
jgi:putative glutamine amidotransferase